MPVPRWGKPTREEGTMSIEENKALLHRFIEAVNKGDAAALAQIVAPDFEASALAGGMELGREAMIGVFSERLKAVPDYRATVIDLVAEGDKVVVFGRDTGTPVVEFMGIAPTGKSFDVTWVDLYHIRDGQIVEMIAEMNMDTMRKQLAG
jgi:steroid delta-isomerase-like uncharacterized protein